MLLVPHQGPFLQRASRVFVLNNEEKAFGLLLLKSMRVSVVQNGIFPPEINPHLSKEPYLLFLGRLHPEKGPDLLIEAFSKYKSEFTLKIAGSDFGMLHSLQEQCEKLGLKGRVEFLGHVKEGKQALIQKAILLVVPSRAEGFGMVILEALSLGTPVLISAGCRFGDVEKWGVGYRSEVDADSLSHTLKAALSNPIELTKRGQAGIAFVKEQFTWGKIICSYIEEYDALCSSE